MDTQEYFLTCPYCWQQISLVLDLPDGQHRWIEDCEVCCHPIQIDCRVTDGEVESFEFVKAQ